MNALIFLRFFSVFCTGVIIDAMARPVTRIAALADMPIIHSLISDSFAAMKKFVDPEPEASTDHNVKNLIEKGDLNPTNFEIAYLKPPNSNYWVVEHSDTKEVCGCVALTQLNSGEAELKRMAVSPTYRGQNFGGILMSNLLKFAAMKGFQRIILGTANPDSMRFYLKHQFVVYQSFQFKLKTTSLTVYKMIHYISEKCVKKISIVGGTHGNERIGVKLVEDWKSHKQHELTSRPTLTTSVLLGNIKAVALNKRFADSDLNRQFTLNENDESFKLPNADTNVQTYEKTRAIELNAILGPKLKQTGPSIGDKDSVISASASDFIIDLHSTECDVGTLLMISGEEDCIAYRVAHHIQSMEEYKDVRITCSRGNKDNSYSIDSLAPSGLAIEVGPLPHGTINQPLLDRTRDIVLAILDYFESQNQKLLSKTSPEASIYEPLKTVFNTTFKTDAQSPDLISPSPPQFPKVDYYKFLGAVQFPEVISSQKVVLHPSFSSNHEFRPLKVGDVVFQCFDTTSGVFILDLPFTLDESLLNQLRVDRNNPELTAAEVILYPAFIGEPAYAASAKAFYLYTLETRSLY